MRNLWTDRPCPLDSLLRFRNDVASELVVSSYVERANDIVRAVQLLRPHGMAVGFPMQTADGEIIFSVGKDTLTADQILELLERDELHLPNANLATFVQDSQSLLQTLRPGMSARAGRQRWTKPHHRKANCRLTPRPSNAQIAAKY